MHADELLRNGDIGGARALLADELRRAPSNVKARQFFWQLIAVAGEWDKAENQLRTLASVNPSAMMLATVYGQVLAAERKRAAVMSGQQLPVSLVGTEPWVDGLLNALHLHARGEAEAAAILESALASAPETPGRLNGESFSWIADGDLRFGPMLELIIGDNYGLVPFAAISRISATGPRDLRDTIWLPVEITLKSGQTSMAFAPAIYPGTQANAEADCLLGRTTNWIEQRGIEVGIGQRLLTSDGPECGILELRELVIG